MGKDGDEDTGRTARLHDIKELGARLDAHALDDQVVYKELKKDVSEVRGVVDRLALDSAQQNGKLDTLVARTEGKLAVMDERTNNLVSRTKSKERVEEKQRDTQAIEVQSKRNWLRDLIKGIIVGLIAAGGALVHKFWP